MKIQKWKGNNFAEDFFFQIFAIQFERFQVIFNISRKSFHRHIAKRCSFLKNVLYLPYICFKPFCCNVTSLFTIFTPFFAILNYIFRSKTCNSFILPLERCYCFFLFPFYKVCRRCIFYIIILLLSLFPTSFYIKILA